MDSLSEDENNELQMNGLPPSLMVDEDQEDFDKFLK